MADSKYSEDTVILGSNVDPAADYFFTLDTSDTTDGAGGTMKKVLGSGLPAAAGITASVAELNHVDGVTFAIQTQLDGKQPLSAVLTNTTASFTTADETKLDGIEAGADVTDATNIAAAIVGASTKLTPVDADGFPIIDSQSSNSLKDVTWLNIKATLKNYFDSFYQAVGTYLTSANITQTITNGVTDKAPSEDAVYDALAAKASSTFLETIAGIIETPSDTTYKLVVKMPYAGTINETTTISTSGTCTATFKVNTTALGGTANSVSSSEQSQTHTTSNTFAAGDDIQLTVSSNSSCANMSFSIKITRTI